jgi:hypothetical protein
MWQSVLRARSSSSALFAWLAFIWRHRDECLPLSALLALGGWRWAVVCHYVVHCADVPTPNSWVQRGNWLPCSVVTLGTTPLVVWTSGMPGREGVLRTLCRPLSNVLWLPVPPSTSWNRHFHPQPSIYPMRKHFVKIDSPVFDDGCRDVS